MPNLLRIVALFLALVGSASAHSDRKILFDPEGNLVGLPDRFLPASLVVTFPPAHSHNAVAQVSLSIAASTFELPPCVAGLLRSTSMEHVEVSASWYHDRSLLPYYLSVTFNDPEYDEDSWANPGFKLLFDLESADLLQMSVQIVRGPGSAQVLPIDVRSMCPSHEFPALL
jgi:hypothetical protein